MGRNRSRSVKIHLTALSAGVVAATLPSLAAHASVLITPPAAVPNTYTDSAMLTGSTAGYALGLAATNYAITPSSGLYSGSPGALEGGQGASGYPTLQGMANLESMVANGSITVSGGSGSGAYTTTYSANFVSSFRDTGINSNNGIATSEPINSIIDEIGYVYVSQANSTYDFNVNPADDGTEILLGGNGTTGNGTVVAAQNANQTLGSTVSSDTAVTFTAAGLYAIEIFNAQTWGGTAFNFSATPTGSASPLAFYSASSFVPTEAISNGGNGTAAHPNGYNATATSSYAAPNAATATGGAGYVNHLDYAGGTGGYAIASATSTSLAGNGTPLASTVTATGGNGGASNSSGSGTGFAGGNATANLTLTENNFSSLTGTANSIAGSGGNGISGISGTASSTVRLTGNENVTAAANANNGDQNGSNFFGYAGETGNAGNGNTASATAAATATGSAGYAQATANAHGSNGGGVFNSGVTGNGGNGGNALVGWTGHHG